MKLRFDCGMILCFSLQKNISVVQEDSGLLSKGSSMSGLLDGQLT